MENTVLFEEHFENWIFLSSLQLVIYCWK